MAGSKIINKIGAWLMQPSKNNIDINPKSNFISTGDRYGSWAGHNLIAFNGEKTPNELGSAVDYVLDYYTMRKRALEAYLTNDVIQNAIEKFGMWVIGSGLKLQSEPIESIINDNSLKYDELTKSIEDQFRLFANSKESTYKNDQNLHQLALEAFKNSKLSGDCLCILRYENSRVTMQVIDGCFISTPSDRIASTTTQIGVELNDKGQQVGYWVMTGLNKWEYISAKNNNGQTVAWLMYSRKYKLSDVRGMSLLSAVLEQVAKLDRYKEATLGAAEENSKIPYTIEHGVSSTGENPLSNQLAQSLGVGNGAAPETLTMQSDVMATKVAMTTSKMVYNMPIDSTLKRHDAKVDINFGEFSGVFTDIIYTTIGMPPEVAMDKFEGSYSSSRAALKSWEYNLGVNRNNLLRNQFYKPFYDFWLDIQVTKGVFKLPGYFNAFKIGDFMQLEAYRNCRFIGATVPHIDPLKEVMAQRKKLGASFDNVPLTTLELACEELNTGDSSQILKKAENEKNISSNFAPIVDTSNSTAKVS